MHVVVAGGTGLIGSALVARLRSRGDQVTVLTRSATPREGELTWDPSGSGTAGSGTSLDLTGLETIDAIVNLAGASIGKLPWTKKYRETLKSSRVDATETLIRAINALPARHSVHLVNGSAVGFYGSRGDELLTETSSPGEGVLADVTLAWEAAASGARKGTLVTFVRTGLVVAKRGAMWPLRLLTTLGLGGKLGSGKQWWPWISLHDEVEAIVWILDQRLAGAINLVGPTAATQSEVSRGLARVMKRPYWLPAPSFALKLVLGSAADEVLLNSQRVRPDALLDSGFQFRDRTIEDALREAEKLSR